MNELTLGSLFDGSGGFPLGGLLAGIIPVWASEIEPFPIRVTTRRMPFMKHYGDVSKLNGGEIEPVDVITFGSPCQDMSVAGKREGLDGNRSVLFYEAVRIIKEMREATNGKQPRFIVWENVPGAFSSNRGEDFKSVLEAVIGIVEPETAVPAPEKNRWPYADCYVGDGWSVAYRTLDAQYWGVPQRRRRIFLVADLAGGCAKDILFKSEGLSGYSAAGFRAWQRTSGSSERSAGKTGVLCLNDQGGQFMDCSVEKTGTLRSDMGGHAPAIAIENHPTDSRAKLTEDDTVQTLTSRMGTGGNNVPLVLKIRSGCEGGGKGPLIQTDRSATLATNNDQTLFEPCAWNGEQVSSTLTANNADGSQRMPDKEHFNCVIQPFGICSDRSHAMLSENPNSGVYEAETSRTIDTGGGNPACNQGGIAIVESFAIQGSMIGRRDENGPQGNGINEDVSFTLNTVDRHAVYAMSTGSFAQVSEDTAPTLLSRDFKDASVVTEPAVGIGRDAFNQGSNAKFKPSFEEELQPTLVAKGPGAVQSGYMVRRLTPTECARLQGFPDRWCDDLGSEEPTMEELKFWYDVFETRRKIMEPDAKPKTLKQIQRWLRDPHSDSAEYKMWGNGVALPCVWFVLAGIVYCTQMEQNAADNNSTAGSA